MKQPPEQEHILTRNRSLAMYRDYPEALAFDLTLLMRPLRSQQDIAAHQWALERLKVLYNDKQRPRIMRALARAMIEAVRTEA